MRAEVLGVRLIGRAGPGQIAGPIDVLEIPLEPGLTAFAGLNGAGKSRTLEGISAALSGAVWVGGDWQVLFRIVDGDSCEPGLEDLVGTVLEAVGFSTEDLPSSESAASTMQEFDAVLCARRDSSWRVWLQDRLMQDLGETPLPASIDEMAASSALAQQACFALTGSGDGAYHLFVAIDRSTGDRALRQLIADIDRRWDEERRDSLDFAGADEEVGNPWWYFRPLAQFGAGFTISAELATSPYTGEVLPVPLHELAHHEPLPRWPIETLDVDRDTDISRLTEDFLSGLIQTDEDAVSILAVQEDRSIENLFDPIDSDTKLDFVDFIGELASKRYSDLTGDVLPLRCHLHPVHTWIGPGRGFSWFALDGAAQAFVTLDQLSRSQQRWARFAIAVAARQLPTSLGETTEWSPWFFIDEPEAGVHRAAERRLAEGFRSLTEELGVRVLVATHSPHLVEHAHHAKVVRRGGNGAVEVTALPPDADEVATALGFEVTDLLGWYRQILFVEGAHDQAAVETLLGDTLAATRTMVLPIRGVKDSAGVVNARLLDFTEARVILLVDGLGQDAADSWERVRDLQDQGNIPAAQRQVLDKFSDERYESVFLREAAARLLRPGASMSRFRVHALSVGDIIELLPEDLILGGKTTWGDARAAYDRTRQAEDFKGWLKQTYGVYVSVKRVRNAAETMRLLPPDLQMLDALLRPE